MNDERIDHLVAQREKLTNRRDGWIDFKRVDAIDAKLQQVEPGTRNDVDLLLGRTCAKIVDKLEAESIRRGIVPQAITIDEVVPLAEAKKKAYDDYLANIADQYEDYKDFNSIKGDCAI